MHKPSTIPPERVPIVISRILRFGLAGWAGFAVTLIVLIGK